MPGGVVVIGYDGSSASKRAVDEGARLLAPARVVVVVVWEPGMALETMDPTLSLVPPLDVSGVAEVDRAMYERAQRLAEEGAAQARQAGVDAEGLAVADERSVADTLLRVVGERSADALVIGAHGHRGVRQLLLGSTSQKVIQHADCPVVVVRDSGEAEA